MVKCREDRGYISFNKTVRGILGVEQENWTQLASVLLGKKRELLGVWRENWKVEEVSNAMKLIKN